MKTQYYYQIYCIKKDFETLKLFFINKFNQLKKTEKIKKNDITVENKSKKYEYINSKRIYTKRLTQSGNWIPIITNSDGLLKTMKQNIEMMDKK